MILELFAFRNGDSFWDPAFFAYLFRRVAWGECGLVEPSHGCLDGILDLRVRCQRLHRG